MTELESVEKALTVSGKTKSNKPMKIWIGFTVNGDQVDVMRKAFEKAGVVNYADYVRTLVLADLRSKLSKQPKAKVEPETDKAEGEADAAGGETDKAAQS